MSEMAKQNLGMEVIEIPERLDTTEVLKRVNSGQYDLAVVDTINLPADMGFHYGVEAILDLSEESLMSWGISMDKESLHGKLNRFLSRKHLETVMARSYREDLPQIKQRKLLRLVTYQSPVNYFYENGRFHGFEYNLINRFAELHGMRLDVVIAESHDEMLELLIQGKGDVIAASSPESRYMARAGIKQTVPYNYATPVLVGRVDEEFADIRDLQGRNVHLPPESPYRQVLERIRSHGIQVTVLDTQVEENTEAVLFGVAQGYYDLTVVGSHELASELSRQINLKAQFNLADPQALVWVVRDENSQLLTALNEYITNEYRRGFYNVIYSRYINNPKTRKANPRLFAHIDQLSPYDDIVNKYADRYGFDWRLIVAQMYQESRFNPGAVSTAGAKGLMQLLPTTARMVGVKNIIDPENNISGGVRYLNYLRGRLGKSMTPEDRTWFTLASYNAGYKRVQQARVLAESMNLDKNKWFNNVEIAMLKMATPYMRNGKASRLCRCGQTAAYVREIRTLYNNYLRLTQSVRAASRLSLEVTQLDEI
jgi:membrane-bound lytic murein transglycosylase F